MRAGVGRPILFSAALLLTAFVAAGCHKKDSVLPPVEATPTPTAAASDTPSPSPSPVGTIAPTSAQTSATLDASGGSLMLSSNGLSGTLAYPASNASGSVGAAFTMSSSVGTLPSPAPTGTPVVEFTLQLSDGVTFQSPLVVSPVSLPSSFQLNGASVFETLYDTTAGVQLGSTVQGTASGQTLTFGAMTTGGFGATAGDVYAFVVSYGAGTSSSSTTHPFSSRRPPH